MTLTRRQLLGSGALAALGYALRGPLVSAVESVTHGLGLPRAAAETPSEPLSAQPPFTVLASSSLSEDWFLTDQVLVDTAAGDQVFPVVRTDGSTVFVVVTAAGAVSLAWPSPGSPGGFTYTAAPELAGAVSAVAGPDATVLVYLQDPTSVAAVTLDANGRPGAPAPLLDRTAVPVTPIRPIGDTGRAAVVTGYPGNSTASLALLGADQLHTTTFDLGFDAVPDSDVRIAPWTPPGGDAGLVGVVLSEEGFDVVTVDLVHLGARTAPVTYADGSPVPAPEALFTCVLPAPTTANGVAVAVMYLDSGQKLWAAAMTSAGRFVGDPVQLLAPGSYAFTPGQIRSATWYQDPASGLVTAYVLAGDTVFQQNVSFGASPGATPPLPLTAGITGAFLPDVGVTANSQLVLAARPPGFTTPALLTLQRRTLGTWTTTPVLQGSATQAQVSCYRTMLTVRDANGLMVAGATLRVTPELDVTAFQPTGALTLPAGTASALTTDRYGQVTLATPATALHTAGFAVSVDDGSAAPVVTMIRPDAGLHAFLANQGPLAGHANVQALLKAQATPTGALPNLPSDEATLTAVAGAINAAMQAGTAGSGAAGPTPFQLTGLGTPQIAVGPPPAGGRLGLGSSHWWDELAHDVESAWHAVEHGAAKVATMVCDKTDAGWFVQLALDVAGYVDQQVIQYVVSDLRSAVAAVGGVFQALGADIVAAVDMLKELVSDLFENTVRVGDVLYGWLTGEGPLGRPDAGIPYAISGLQALKGTLHTAFSHAEADIRSTLTSTLSGGPNASSSPASLLSSHSGNADANTAGGMGNNAKANWLLDKTRSSSVSGPSSAGSTGSTATTVSAAVDASSAPAAAGQALAAGPQVGSASDIGAALTFASIEAMLAALLTDGLEFVEELVDVMIDLTVDGLQTLQDDLTASLGDLPLVGDLFTTVLKVSAPTVGQVLCYVLGFGISVVGELLFPGEEWFVLDGASTAAPAAAAVGDAPHAWQKSLAVINIFTTAASGILSAANDVTEGDTGFAGILGAVAGVVQNLVVYPFDADNATFAWSPYRGADDDPFGANGPEDIWYIGFVPPVGDIVVASAGTPSDPDMAASLEKVEKIALPIIDTIIGVASLVIGVIAADDAHQTPDVVAGIVIGAVPLIGKLFTVDKASIGPLIAAILDVTAGILGIVLDVETLVA